MNYLSSAMIRFAAKIAPWPPCPPPRAPGPPRPARRPPRPGANGARGGADRWRGWDAATPAGDAFSPFRVGLDHLALGCAEEAELERVAAGLSAAGVANTGVKLDLTLNKKYVAFKDPDGIAWELFMQ